MKPITATRKDFEAQALPQLANLLRTACYVSGGDGDAHHLVKITIGRAYHSWHKFQVIPDCRVWLFKTLATVLADKYGSVPRLSSADADAAAIGLAGAYVRSSQFSASAISVEDVEQILTDLPDHLKLMVVLSRVEGFSYRDIANIVGIAVETVRARLHQGRTLIREALVNRVAGDGMFDMAAEGVRGSKMR